MYPWISPRTASLYTIVWFSTIRWPTLCAKLPKCDTTLFLEDDIKIYDASKLTAVFSRTQLCLYQYLWICKVSSLEDTLSWRNLPFSGRDMFSLIIFLDFPIHGFFFQNPKDLALPDWLRSIMDCNGRTGWFRTTWQNIWLQRPWLVQKTTYNNLVYVKEYEKQEWLQNLLQDDAREDVYIENIDAHYEDIESLNKLNITHTSRCQKYVTNCALQNVFKLFNWWHQRHQK